MGGRSRLNLLVAWLTWVAWLACGAAAFSQTEEKSGKSQQYEGPSIISRDSTLIGERGGKLLDFRFYASLNGVYDSGLTPVLTDKTGNLVTTGGAYGVAAGFGVTGSKTWRRDSLSLDYNGSYRKYADGGSFDGLDQFLSLRYGRTISRRLILDVKETGGISGLGNGNFSFLPLTSNDLHAIPTNELFDNRTEYSQSTVGLVWQKSARLSFRVDGDGSVVRRKAGSLAGLNGYGVGGDVSYRITRRQTLSLTYRLMHYDYQRLYGSALAQTASVGYSIGLGRRYDLATSIGGTYANLVGLQTVQLDPAIVAIIGQTQITENFNRTAAIPYGSVSLTRRFSHSAVSATANTGISPGNGAYLTSRQTSAGVSYSYAGRQRWSSGAKFDYTKLSALGQQIGQYSGVQGGVGATYRVTNAMHAEFRYDYRHYSTQNDLFRKDSHRISVGLAFSPGDKPLSIW